MGKMDKKNIEYVILGIIIVLAIISVIFASLKDKAEVIPGINEEPEVVDDMGLSDEDTLNKAIELGDPAICQQIENTVLRVRCLSFTDTSEPVYTEEQLAEQALMNEAVESNDVTGCEAITDTVLRVRCLSFTDTSEPELVVEESQEFNSTEPIVEVVDEPSNDEVLFDEAVSTNNPALCEEIQNAILKNRCKSFTS